MANLPKGLAVYENVQAAQYDGPAILKLLKDTKLSGYARFAFFSGSAHLLFTDGCFIHLLVETKDAELTGLEGITKLFELIVTEGGRLDVYRTSPSLIRLVMGFLQGTRIHEAQALRLIDRKALLEGIRLQRLDGVLHIYTEDRSSMIFYRDGVPLGFFHDGTEDLATAAGEFQNIAAMPDAVVDVTKTKAVDEGSILDILEMINVEKIWQACAGKHAARREAGEREAAEKEKAAREGLAAAKEKAVLEIGGTFLGKLGKALVEKEIAARGGRNALLDPAAVESLLAAVEKGAKLLTSASKTKELLEALRGELIGRERVAAG